MKWLMTHSSWQRSPCFFFSASTRWLATWSCFGSDGLFDSHWRADLRRGHKKRSRRIRIRKQKQHIIRVVPNYIDNLQEFAMVKRGVILPMTLNVLGALLRHAILNASGVVAALWILLNANSAAAQARCEQPVARIVSA